MKFIAATVLVSLSFSALGATTNPQECLKQKKSLDRRYCLDSYLETVREAQAAERKTLAAGIPETTKAERVALTEQDIAARKDYLNMMKTEVELQEKFLEELKSAKVAAAAAPAEAPKKKKRKKGFQIKL